MIIAINMWNSRITFDDIPVELMDVSSLCYERHAYMNHGANPASLLTYIVFTGYFHYMRIFLSHYTHQSGKLIVTEKDP